MLDTLFRKGAFVAYGGRAGRIRGVEPIAVEGSCIDAIAIDLTSRPGGVAFVPLSRARAQVVPISEGEARDMDQALTDRSLDTSRRHLGARTSPSLSRNARLAEYGRLGGLTKFRKHTA